MGKKLLMLCVCQGTCPSFHKMNIFQVLNNIRAKKIVDAVALHPQLCSEDGDEYLRITLKGDNVDALYVAGCDPRMQKKMFRDAFEEAGFNIDRHVAVDIRNMDTEQATKAIEELISSS